MEGRIKLLAVCCIVIVTVVLWPQTSKSIHIDTQLKTPQRLHIRMDKPVDIALDDSQEEHTNTTLESRSTPPKTDFFHGTKSCTSLPDDLHLVFTSQSLEDKAIYERFFMKQATPTLCHGIFVEIGALDGLTYSNSLFFERTLNWSGVLIEGNPELTDQLNANRPHTRNYGGLCPCPENQTDVLFVANGNQAVGGVLDHMSAHHFKAYFKEGSMFINVPCKPMGAILNDAGVKSVDIFFIDVEGSEHVVLQTMDWTIPVHIIMVEMGHSQAKDKLIRDYLEQEGFVNTLPEWDIRSYCESGGDCAQNEVFINPNYPQLPSKKTR